jgi:DNA helicase-2/ATP-dependent DNA helicase PcrA
MENSLEGLNQQQRRAVLTTEGHVRVIAGAGTGKTRTLTQRFCYLVSELGISPRNILCVTFTNRAAQEMKQRIRAKLGECDLGYICTFHALCVQILRDEIFRLNFPKNFLILDVEDEKQILSTVFENMRLSMRQRSIHTIIDEVLEAKKFTTAYIEKLCFAPAGQLKHEAEQAADLDEAIFLNYMYEQKKCYGCDFNDLINFALYLFSHYEDVRTKWQDRMQYVMVDEFQDVSEKQYRIARILSEKHGNLFVVGDPDQTIYYWRGAHVEMILDFDKKYKDAKTVTVTENYRSTPEILAATNKLILKNTIRFSKELTAVKPHGPKPQYYHASDEKDEAKWIYTNIMKCHEAGIQLKKIAVLYRAHYLTRFLEEYFIERQLPYKIYSGVEFYSRREIKDIVCYMRMLYTGDDLSFIRTINRPTRHFGRKRLNILRENATRSSLSLYETLKRQLDAPYVKGSSAEQYVMAIEDSRALSEKLKLSDLLQHLLNQTGYEELLRKEGDQERLDNVAEFKRAVERVDKEELTLSEFLDRIALFSNLDQEERDAVKLMTVHAAKGNEFSAVFLCGFSEGIFPSRRIETPEEMEEERRLAYVAMTRAQNRLYISDSAGIANDNLFKYPSRFIFDIGGEYLDFIQPIQNVLEQPVDVKEATCTAPVYKVGDRVVHKVFGPGMITAVNRSQSCYDIKFDKLATMRNLSFKAPLTSETEKT